MIAGAVISSADLLERLNKDEIFRRGSWDHDNIRAAAYDLRIAEDFLIIPDPRNNGLRRYGRGERCTVSFVLRSGDVAFVSTEEKLCIPWDLSGNIGIKFGFARRNLLVLTGLLVDPGFGLELKPDGQWVAKDDERLHFLIVNIGTDNVAVSPGESVASVQFIRLSGSAKRTEVVSGRDMEHEFFNPQGSPSIGIGFFAQMAELRARVDNLQHELQGVERGAHQVVLFGVFLVAATVFGAVFTYLIAFLGNDKLVEVLGALTPDVSRAVLLVAMMIFIGALALSVTMIWSKRMSR